MFEVHMPTNSIDEAVRRLRPAAAGEGCDGLVLEPLRHHWIGLAGVEAVVVAHCVVYLPPPVVAPTAPPIPQAPPPPGASPPPAGASPPPGG
jgi:hypothetical protein